MQQILSLSDFRWIKLNIKLLKYDRISSPTFSLLVSITYVPHISPAQSVCMQT